jgi:hypothetical protein
LKDWQPEAQTVFSAPKDYFDNLSDTIFEKINIQSFENEEDKEIELPKFLKDWQPEAQTVFSAPKDYFDNLESKILAQTTSKKQLVAQPYMLKIKRMIIWTVAASFALLIVFKWAFQQNFTPSVDAPIIVDNTIKSIENQKNNAVLTPISAPKEIVTIPKMTHKTVENESPQSSPEVVVTDVQVSERTDKNLVELVQKDYQNGKNDLEVLNKNLEKIFSDPTTEGGEVMDLLQFSDEEIEAAIGGGL